jgi:hypothetical protein
VVAMNLTTPPADLATETFFHDTTTPAVYQLTRQEAASINLAPPDEDARSAKSAADLSKTIQDKVTERFHKLGPYALADLPNTRLVDADERSLRELAYPRNEPQRMKRQAEFAQDVLQDAVTETFKQTPAYDAFQKWTDGLRKAFIEKFGFDCAKAEISSSSRNSAKNPLGASERRTGIRANATGGGLGVSAFATLNDAKIAGISFTAKFEVDNHGAEAILERELAPGIRARLSGEKEFGRPDGCIGACLVGGDKKSFDWTAGVWHSFEKEQRTFGGIGLLWRW